MFCAALFAVFASRMSKSFRVPTNEPPYTAAQSIAIMILREARAKVTRTETYCN